jgi:predicted nucleic acid-binding protein
MGQLTPPPSGIVYVDANAVIYHVERIDPYYTTAAPLWDALDRGLAAVTTSELTLLEVLVKPLRLGNTALANLYRTVLLGTAGFTTVPVSRAILEAAALYRAVSGLKSPDAIHAASAVSIGCVSFVTNDVAFRRVAGLSVEVLSEIAAS